jgi:translation initiation factor IF-3
MVGIVNIEEAMRRAREAGLDLVEVAADSDPPVCRIRDYGKFKYEQSKKDKASRARSKMAEMKEVRLGRSMKIDPHDVEIRMSQARRFLMEGHKVQIVQNFRGREMIHRERGSERMRDIIERLSDISKLETPPRQAGKRLTMILAPDKSKIEQVRRREAAAKQAAAQAADGSTPQAAGGGPGPDDAGAAREKPAASDAPPGEHPDAPPEPTGSEEADASSSNASRPQEVEARRA